ncbi:hypothetical protein AHAS_Ahas20G0247600 [Arachis hypogaea]
MDETMSKGDNISSERPPARAHPFLPSANSAQTSRINIRSFCPPRNETRLASSSHSGDPQALVTCTKPQDGDEVANIYSKDEDYDPETDWVESFYDHVDDLFAAQEVEGHNNANNRKDTNYWIVNVIGIIFSPILDTSDFFPCILFRFCVTIVTKKFIFSSFEDGMTKGMSLSIKEAIALPLHRKIIL